MSLQWTPKQVQENEIRDALQHAFYLIKMSDAVLNCTREIAADVTEQNMAETITEEERQGDVHELLEQIQNDKNAPAGVRKLAESTSEFLTDWENETAYNGAMEIVKK